MTADLTTFNLADIWEAVSDRVADRTAVISGGTVLGYADLEEQANRLANWMAAQGVGPGDHVGLYLGSCAEYFVGMLAAYKLRAAPINVNHRYVESELAHLFRDAGVVGVLYHREFAARAEAVRAEVPEVRWWLEVDDGSGDAEPVTGSVPYADALAGASPERSFGPRSSDDPYVIYTGGTTGMPKGVVWRSEDAFYACIGGGDPMRMFGGVDEPGQVVERIIDGTFTFLPVAPLMHAAGQWTSLSWLFSGGTVVLLPGPLDPVAVWTTIQEHKINLITVVGDAVVRPLVDAWDATGPYDVSSLFSIGSGGAPLTPSLRRRLMDQVPGCAVVDGFGSSETGAQGAQRMEAGAEPTDGVTQFKPYGDTTMVVDELTRQPVEPGSDTVGRVALTGRIPLRYHNDPEKSAATFVEVDGRRFVLTGDMATVAEDGTITLLGRGSGCINTGGEKVFPEEVEAALKAHPDVYDALVVGTPDERWGQKVTALVQPVGGAELTLEGLAEHCRATLAGYKVPKALVVVDHVERSPAGKPDYRWAERTATA